MTGLTGSIPDYILRSAGISTDGKDDNNFLGKNYYQFVISRIPNFERFVRSVTVPTFSFGELVLPTTLNTSIKYPGGNITFDPLVVQFAVDERFFTYMELYNWIEYCSQLSTPDVIELKAQTSDATLLVMNSAYRPNKKIVFKGLYPISLGPLEFTSIEPSAGPMLSTATFNYTYFKVEEF